jgi:H2-forming N5,N10-methylenetetrahydromethanopterin dehydrogenase-like enzyme
MSALTVDTLAVAQLLRKRGFTEEQATGVVEALKEIDASQLVTKSDLREAIADLKVDMVRWLVVTQIALAGFLFAAMKFVK